MPKIMSKTGISSAEMSHFPSSPYVYLCVVYERTFTQHITPPSDLWKAQGGFVGLLEDLWVSAKDQEKCFLINYSGSHNPFWAERRITLRDALRLRGVSFPLPACLTPSFPPSLNHSSSVPFLPPLRLRSLSLSYPVTLSFTLPEMDPVLGQAVCDNGGN